MGKPAKILVVLVLAGPPHLRPTWPPEVDLGGRFGVEGASFDVAAWGRISVTVPKGPA